MENRRFSMKIVCRWSEPIVSIMNKNMLSQLILKSIWIYVSGAQKDLKKIS